MKDQDREHIEDLKRYDIEKAEWDKYQENGSDARPPERPAHPKDRIEVNF